MTSQDTKMTVLVYGAQGWIGRMICRLLTDDKDNGMVMCVGAARLENREAILRDIDNFYPTHVINAAGVTGCPNVDWCESHKQETIRSNVIGTLNLADVCYQRNIYCMTFGTGCIYEYDEFHPIGSGMGFTEQDPANFSGSFYSRSKGMTEELLRTYPNVCVLRLRMPISDDLHPRSLITKIIKYDKVVNIPNSVTVLADLLPLAIIIAKRSITGVFNFTNPGVISHNEVLDLYKEYIDPSFTYNNFTVEEQSKVLKAARSNNELDTHALQHALPDVTIAPIRTSIHEVFKRMAEKI